ncbi:family 3 encapsulin nanocompartment shell protein [Spirillospora sp. NPDC048911]|uniref:family 3 encapsulin nanocompartment shell protein n=1 Tax=Spirillospora sp. NPDC048911 TaxID=3364527 RepID=UPI003723599D
MEATAMEATATARPTPGEAYAAAVRRGERAIPLNVHLPAAFPLFGSRPRYAVRHLLKTADVPDGPLNYVHEPAGGVIGAAGTSYAATPESAFHPQLRQVRLTDMRVSLPLPEGIMDDLRSLANFVDYRLLVRLSVVENESLLHGTADGAITGMLDLPGLRERKTTRGLAETVTETAAEVEETGGSCDGIVVHPAVYWEMVQHGVLDRLDAPRIMVSRTRMIPKDTMLFGDFRAAFTLFLPQLSEISVTGDAVSATSRFGLAVHLPQHLVRVNRV